MEEIDIPPYFLCPISLEIMRDPVTLSTGITYDRVNIERWLFSSKKDICPVTKQVLLDNDLTPNHTLRRLIQAWCILNASNGIERIPTPKQPIDKDQIVQLINKATTMTSPQSQLISLRRLRTIALESDRNKICMQSAGAVEFLASIVSNNNSRSIQDITMEEGVESTRASDEALGILYNLQISEAGLRSLIGKNGEFIDTLVQILRHGNYQSRAYATLLLKPILEVANPIPLISLRSELFVEIVNVLRDQISHHVFKAALQILIQICPWGRNKVKAVDAGAVSILIDLLLEKLDKRASEMIIVVLDQLCGCAEGRSELLKHGAGLAVVSKKILRVSLVASERAVKILLSISKFSATSSVLQEMLQVGVVSKLCLALQVECTKKTKEKVKEILKLHSKAWKNSPCIHSNLLSSYPS